MYDCWVERDRLRIVMSSIMRRRRGLIAAIGDSCREGRGCDDPHPLRQETLDQQLSSAARAATPAQRVRSMRTAPRACRTRVRGDEAHVGVPRVDAESLTAGAICDDGGLCWWRLPPST